jgi:hypothetical protein
MSVQEYLDKLAQEAGLEEEVKGALKKALGNTKFVEELDKGIKRQSDYSRSMDELKTQKSQVDNQIQQWREWYNTAVANDAAREEELQRLRGGNGNAPVVTPAATNPGFSKKDLEEREGRMVQIVKQGMRLASRHAAKFGEELDTDALEKLAVEKGLTLDRAYDELVRPRVEESREKEFAEKLKLAREEGVREGLSKREIPGESDKGGFNPFFGNVKATDVVKGLPGSQRVANFEEAWNKAAETSKR